MGSLYDLILADMKKAMLDKDVVKRDCLRGVVSEVKNATVNAGKELSEEAVIAVLKKAAKQRHDSIKSFRDGGREELAAKEEHELKVIESYLPKMLTEEAVQTLILKIIIDNKIPESKKNMGMIMKELRNDPSHDLIDMKYASTYLNTLLK